MQYFIILKFNKKYNLFFLYSLSYFETSPMTHCEILLQQVQQFIPIEFTLFGL